jgi:hypothetical protein
LQQFRCTEHDPEVEYSIAGMSVRHPEIWALHAQDLIREKARSFRRERWIVRFGCDEEGVGAVIAAEEIDPGDLYNITVGAIACRLRGKYGGLLGREMFADMREQIFARCVEMGVQGEIEFTGMIHRENEPSQRMCRHYGMQSLGPSAESEDYDDWSGMFSIPPPELLLNQ